MITANLISPAMLSVFAPNSVFDRPSLLHTLLSSPIAFLARVTYISILWLRPWSSYGALPVRLVCISDTHTKRAPIPDGDILVHAGDLTNAGTVVEIQEQIDWLDSLPHAHKVAIAGNHDTYLDARSRATLARDDMDERLTWRGIHYLQHSEASLYVERCKRRLRVFGAPQIPACGGPEFAFQYPRGQDAWSNTIPSDLDILITHTPPKWHLDLPASLGCEWLLKEAWKTRPRVHVFGHVHAARGSEAVYWDGCQSAYERICDRSSGRPLSFIGIASYVDLGRMFFYGMRAIVWRLLWRGEERGGLMINAALMSQCSGNLDQMPQVFKI